jgi:hypothetical protein
MTGANMSGLKATLVEPEIVTHKGKPVSVTIPIQDYKEMLERTKYAEDTAWLKRARLRSLHCRPLEDYRAERNHGQRARLLKSMQARMFAL